MSEFYDEMRVFAGDMLAEFTQAEIKLIRPVKGSGPGYNPGAKNPPLEFTFRGGVGKGVKKFVAGTTVTVDELQVITDVLDGVTPSRSDQLSIDGVLHPIIEIENKPAIGRPIVHVFKVQK